MGGLDKEKEAGVLDHGEMVRLDLCERSELKFVIDSFSIRVPRLHDPIIHIGMFEVYTSHTEGQGSNS